MSKYNQSVLTDAGLALAKKANAGEAKFKITRVATSSTNLSDKSVEELQKVAELPNIMQYGKILEANDVETDNVALGISCRFTNDGLKNGYDVQTVGLFAQEEGTDHDFLFALSTAVAPEHMPDFSDLVLYRFTLNFYVVVGRTSAVTVWVDDKTVVTIKKFEDHIKDANAQIEALKKQLEEAIKEGGKVKGTKINDGSVVEPDNQGILNLIVNSDRIQDFPEDITDLNNLKDTGTYQLANLSVPQALHLLNGPEHFPGIGKPQYRCGLIKVIEYSNYNGSSSIFQIYFHSTFTYIFYRSLDINQKWHPWRLINTNELSDDDIKELINKKADTSSVYTKDQLYTKDEVYSKEEVNTQNSKAIKTIEGNGPDASGEAKLPNFKFATAFNPVSKEVTTDTNKYDSHTVVTPEALSALAEKVNAAYDMAKYARDNTFLVKAFHKADEAKAEAWCAEDPLKREAHILDN